MSSTSISYPHNNSVREAAQATIKLLLKIKFMRKFAQVPSKLFSPILCFPNVLPINEAAASPKNKEIYAYETISI